MSCPYTADHIVYVYLHIFFCAFAFFSCRLFFARVRVLCLPCVLVIVLSFCCVWLVCLRLCLTFMFLACACVCLARLLWLCIFTFYGVYFLVISFAYDRWKQSYFAFLIVFRGIFLHSWFFQKSLQRLLHFNTPYLAHRHAALPPSFDQNEIKLVDIRARPCFWCVVPI